MNARTASVIRAAVAFTPPEPETAFEQHFTPDELGALWRMHPSTVRKMFSGVAGIVRTRGAVRIPRSIAERKYQELMG